MTPAEKCIASLFCAPANVLDKLVRHAGALVYIVEYQYPHADGYGFEQHRHQRRYADVSQALRRFDWLIANPEKRVEKAFIYHMPIDLSYYRARARAANAVCTRCGSHDWKFNVEGIDE